MKLMDDFRRRADDFRDLAATLRDDLNSHGESVAAAVRVNTAAIALVALVSVVALLVAMRR